MRHLLTLAAILALTACASTQETRPGPGDTVTPAPVAFSLAPASFRDIPDWQSADLAPALTAFRRSCAGRAQRDPTAALPGGGQYGGTVADWAPACAAAQSVQPGGERAFFEQNFVPHAVRGDILL
jgi:membrane-bound lytic murein transglycosylase A